MELELELTEDDEKWEQLLAKPKAKNLMRTLAKEASTEYLAGQTTDILIDEDGQLKPS